ncbi:hypothetical protein V2J09_011861 [Rumex salicifolius]
MGKLEVHQTDRRNQFCPQTPSPFRGGSSATPSRYPQKTQNASILRRVARRIAMIFRVFGVGLSAGTGSRSGASSYTKQDDSFGSARSVSGHVGSMEFSYQEILKATNNFSKENMIGEGGFATVYKGRLKDGSFVAVKRAKSALLPKRSGEDFKNEILALSQIEHMNLMRLYGYIEHKGEMLIVVEYISNGNLLDHLDGTKGIGIEIAQRLDIAIDVAHGIAYLHNYNDPPIVHRDIKSSNILITKKLRAKVADFGFARILPEDEFATHISTQIKGTVGYLDPEYLKTNQLTEKSDVYSFGVLLVELVTGRRPLEPKRGMKERLTTKWALEALKDDAPVIAMDPRLRRNPASIMAVQRMLKLADKCLADLRPSRPSMKECVEELWLIRKEYKKLANLSSGSSRRSADFVQMEKHPMVSDIQNGENFKNRDLRIYTYPTGNDDTGDNRNEGDISEPSFSLQGHNVRKDGREKRRRSTDGLVERHRKVSEGDVTANNRGAENDAESRDFEKLNPRSDHLERNDLQPGDRDVAEERTGRHVAHREEDRVLESIIAEEVLVQQQDADVGRVPEADEAEREQSAGGFHGLNGGGCEDWIPIGSDGV